MEPTLKPKTAPIPSLLHPPRPLVFATYLAPSLYPLYAYITAAVGASLERPTRLIVGQTYSQLCDGDIDFAFICGLPYVRLRTIHPAPVIPLVAPVLRPARYQNKPIYFSDVIVQADSPVRRFNDLQGKTWAYNEPDSHSGYLITLFHLLATHRTPDFFSKRIRTDFHQNSIQSVAEGVVDASAIDSHVLTIYMRDHPELLSKIRVIDTLGPSTIQPLVACSHIAETLREDVIQIVTGLDSDIHSALERALVSRFIPIKDHDYDDIRAMLASVEAHHFSL